MYKLILVEDEPGAAENIKDILRLYCPRFELAASAECGEDGLALALRHKPDLVLTDIRMPRMDGLELIKKLNKDLPSIKTIIISGYQDFEYATTAMRYGAADYLLKPVTPRMLQAALDRIAPHLDEHKNQKKLALVRQMLNNGVVSNKDLKKYFAAPAYTVAVSRKNGLPGRFSRNAYSLKFVAGDENLDVCGRDEMESIHICSDNSVQNKEAFDRINWLHSDIPGYTTTVIHSDPFSIEKFPEIIKSLYTLLDSSLTIGVSQIISNCASSNRQTIKTREIDYEMSRFLEHYINQTKIGEIYNSFLDFLENCKQKNYPQIYVEKTIRLLFEKLRFRMNHASGDDEFEFMIDDAFFYATSYDELKENLEDILKKLLQEESRPIEKVDSPEFFELIREYISLHLAERLTLQSMCKHFGISQTYISRMFRKYTDMSFIDYLTKVRIEKAKEMLLNKNLPIKDIAPLVGFSDQFYFSRVFHSVTGQSPSKYGESGPV